MNRRKIGRGLLKITVAPALLLNVVAGFHAYKFTHYDPDIHHKTSKPDQISFSEKIKTLAFGVNNPRPVNKGLPGHPFESVSIQSNKRLAGWLINAEASKGTVILFHGYSGHKSSMLDKANIFHDLGYNTLLIDFMGSGDSEGNQTTIGFDEAQHVKDAFRYMQKRGETNILLFGTSMGAAAIMKAQKDYQLKASALLLECPFGTMLETVKARFHALHVPSFPMAYLLVFWGGFENNFNAFSHNPEEYASFISCPTVLMYGEKDIDVSPKETEAIFQHLKGPKTLCTYPLAGHENYLNKYREKWIADVSSFLSDLETRK